MVDSQTFSAGLWATVAVAATQKAGQNLSDDLRRTLSLAASTGIRHMVIGARPEAGALLANFQPDLILTVRLPRTVFSQAVTRIALICAYRWGGINKPVDFESATPEARHFELEPPGPIAVATILTEALRVTRATACRR